jgi:molecular chaperone DnaK
VGRCFTNVDDESLDDKLTREDVEDVVKQRLDEGLGRIVGLLDRAGVDPVQVSLCLAVGGMSNMPAIRARLHEWFGVDRVRISPRSATLIAEGAAWIAHDGTNLQLAKPVELTLARNSRLPLLRAGRERAVLEQA